MCLRLMQSKLVSVYGEHDVIGVKCSSYLFSYEFDNNHVNVIVGEFCVNTVVSFLNCL